MRAQDTRGYNLKKKEGSFSYFWKLHVFFRADFKFTAKLRRKATFA